MSPLVSAGECEHYASVVVVKGSEEKNLLFLQDMLVSAPVSESVSV